MTKLKTSKHLDASKLLGFVGSKPKVGDKRAAPSGVQSKVGLKAGIKAS